MARRGNRRPVGAPIALCLLLVVAALGIAGSAAATSSRVRFAPARINGSGSSYVALAMQQWVADGQASGLEINYLPTGAPQGLAAYGQGLIDFSASEAEFSALQVVGGEATRGFQYVPDVAGATAVLYNVKDKAGRKVDYLHLSPRTIAKIFTGGITKWSDPAISEDNKGLVLPDEPITVVYRSGQSGQTGTFYDFIEHVAPDIFGPWAARHQFPTGDVRIIQLDSSPDFAPKTLAFNGSDQIAQHIASNAGLWTIGFNEFSYSKTYGASAAWIQNKAGEWVLPYAENISAALEGAALRPDLSQELSGVYDNTNPLAYPISAYSYLITQCAPAGDRPTCKEQYPNPGVTETLQRWMRYIACDGQINMARIGYSPLPPNLSQELVNSIARLTGDQPEILTADNCANPRFRGSLGEGAGSPKDPLDGVTSIGPGPGGANDPTAAAAATSAAGGATTASGSAGATGTVAAGTEGGADAVAASGAAAEGAAVGRGGTVAVGGGSTQWRTAAPVLFERPAPPPPSSVPLTLLLAILVVPPVIGAVWSRRRPSELNRQS